MPNVVELNVVIGTIRQDLFSYNALIYNKRYSDTDKSEIEVIYQAVTLTLFISRFLEHTYSDINFINPVFIILG